MNVVLFQSLPANALKVDIKQEVNSQYHFVEEPSVFGSINRRLSCWFKYVGQEIDRRLDGSYGLEHQLPKPLFPKIIP